MEKNQFCGFGSFDGNLGGDDLGQYRLAAENSAMDDDLGSA